MASASRAGPQQRNTMKSIGCVLVASLVVSGAPTGIAAAPAPLDEYVLTSWTDELRSLARSVNGMTQDAEGYLWLATENGLLRFDGVRFARPASDQGVPLSSIYRGRNAVWVGPSASGIERITGEQARHDVIPGALTWAEHAVEPVAHRSGSHERVKRRFDPGDVAALSVQEVVEARRGREVPHLLENAVEVDVLPADVEPFRQG